MRLSTPDDLRIRFIGGLFWEDYRIQTAQNFLYASPEAGFTGTFAPVGGVPTFEPGPRLPGTAFLTDITRGYRQKAVFGEIAFDICLTR